MKRISIFIIVLLAVVWGACAQDYTITTAGQEKNGQYYVTVTTVLDKKQNKAALDWLVRLAVDGVMFRGTGGYPSQQPLVKDPSAKQLKAEFFDAFYNEQQYKNYSSLERESVSVTKLPKKKFEVSGRVTVDKERLLAFLSKAGIVKSFDDLW